MVVGSQAEVVEGLDAKEGTRTSALRTFPWLTVDAGHCRHPSVIV
jgi:hypothetical protein